MHNSQHARIKRLADHGFCERDIVAITGYSPAQVRGVTAGKSPLREVARAMLRRVPIWWRGTSQAYATCVRANFGDVL